MRPGQAQEDMESVRRDAPLDLSDDIAAAIRLSRTMPEPGLLRPLTGPESPVSALLRCDAADIRDAGEADLVLINPDTVYPAPLPFPLSPLPAVRRRGVHGG